MELKKVMCSQSNCWPRKLTFSLLCCEMAETKQDDAEPAVTNTPDQQQNTNNRELDVLQEVVALLSSPVPDNADAGSLSTENRQLRNALTRMTAMAREKTSSSVALEKKVEAMNLQVSSLKDVVAITKDLLGIRNMEVQHLHADMDSIQGKMEAQRLNHNEMINKLDNALKLNEQLKKEYETQLNLFRSLKEKYEQRAILLENLHNGQTTSANTT